MNIKFYDMEDDENPLNESIIRSPERLHQILLSLQQREPFSCELSRENGSQLIVGVGWIGCAEYSRDGDAPYLCAVTNRKVIHVDAEFLAGGTSTPIAARFCMPFDDVIKIAVYFMRTGETCPLFAWEMI